MIGFHKINGINWLTAEAEPENKNVVVEMRGKKYIPDKDGLIPVRLASHWSRVKTVLLINNKLA